MYSIAAWMPNFGKIYGGIGIYDATAPYPMRALAWDLTTARLRHWHGKRARRHSLPAHAGSRRVLALAGGMQAALTSGQQLGGVKVVLAAG